MENIYASCLAYDKKGLLLIGKSGSGKSDICLRMIMQKGAVLVADDRVDLTISGNNLVAQAPSTIAGLLEVRGIGLIKFPYQKQVVVKLAIELVDDYAKIERMPDDDFIELVGLKIPKIKLYPFEFSALDKILLAMK